ncbi:MAG: hypothetical protein EOO68_11380 [Moraxellaceae bacterium]|nr:MAG: hypothetical protein EOO68_11380 [Moraxellaceae bacterium]
MKFFIAITALLTLFAGAATGQDKDMNRLAIGAFVPDELELNPAAKNQLEMKMRSALANEGISSNDNSSRFMMTVNVHEADKKVTATAPAMIAYTLNVDVYIADLMDRKSYGSTSFTLKGVGETETKAYNSALNQLKPDDARLKDLITNSKTKIVRYYTAECGNIQTQARLLSDAGKYEEAVHLLMSVPSASNDCHAKSLQQLKSVYTKYTNQQCKISLNKAKQAWNSTRNYEGAQAAAQHLSNIDPLASCYKEASDFATQMGKEVQQQNNREWDFKMKVLSSAIDLEKQYLQAYKEVAESYIKSQPQTHTIVREWLY